MGQQGGGGVGQQGGRGGSAGGEGWVSRGGGGSQPGGRGGSAWRAVSLLRSRRRTFLFLIAFTFLNNNYVCGVVTIFQDVMFGSNLFLFELLVLRDTCI